jgi:transcriptional regulator with XRE-family HTH domain
MPQEDPRRLGLAVRDRRGELGLSQEDFSRRAGSGLSLKQLQRIERGMVRPRAATLGALDRAAGWTSGSARRVLDGGEPSLAQPEPELLDDFERAVWALTSVSEAERRVHIELHRARLRNSRPQDGEDHGHQTTG